MKKYFFLFSCFLFAFLGLNAQTLSFQSGVTMTRLSVSGITNQVYIKTGTLTGLSWSGKIYKRLGYKTGFGYQGVYTGFQQSDKNWGFCGTGVPEEALSSKNMRVDMLIIPVALTTDLTFWKKLPLQWNISAGTNFAFIQNYRNTYYTRNNQTEIRNVAPQKNSGYFPAFHAQFLVGTEVNYPLSRKLSLGLGGQCLVTRLGLYEKTAGYSVYSTANWRFW